MKRRALVAILISCGPSAGEPAAPSLGDCPAWALAGEPTSPSDFGRRAIDTALANAHVSATIALSLDTTPEGAAALAQSSLPLDPRAESFIVTATSGGFTIVAHDEVGLMYGALDVAEWVSTHGTTQGVAPRARAPVVAIRAANLFLSLPAPSETKWWFRQPDFWREYLDLLARARFDVLDAHGMYNPANGEFPNALLYFGNSDSEPRMGVDADARSCDRQALSHVLEMARVRGIRVALMTYSAGTSLGATVSPTEDDAAVARYTLEAARDLATSFPTLFRLGFRIGETKRDASFYARTFVAGVQSANTHVPIATRTWGTTKPEVLTIAALGGPDTIVEAKFDGEQLGAPYAIIGGSFLRWPNYSYEDYLSPPAPYTFVTQIRVAGTHRGFRNSSAERTRRTVQSLAAFPRMSGFTFEAGHAYWPGTDSFAADPKDGFSTWTFRRDELATLMFGHLGYDPSTPDDVFRAALRERVGTDALWDPVQAASEIVPWIQLAHTCGPDGGDFAPDLEWGGPVGYWAAPPDAPAAIDACKLPWHGPFDTFAVASPFDAAGDLVNGRGTSRLSPLAIANFVLAAAEKAKTALALVANPPNAEALDNARECVALADLGEYFAHKLRAATALAVYERTGQTDYLAAARDEASRAHAGWTSLAADTAWIAPFAEPLRMAKLGAPVFHWRSQLARMPEDDASIDAIENIIAAAPPDFQGALPNPRDWLSAPRAAGPGLASLEIGADVVARFSSPLPDQAAVNLLYKPFSATSDWSVIAMARDGDARRAPAPGARGMFAVEIVGGPGVGWRYPDVLEGVPYVTRAP